MTCLFESGTGRGGNLRGGVLLWGTCAGASRRASCSESTSCASSCELSCACSAIRKLLKMKQPDETCVDAVVRYQSQRTNINGLHTIHLTSTRYNNTIWYGNIDNYYEHSFEDYLEIRDGQGFSTILGLQGDGTTFDSPLLLLVKLCDRGIRTPIQSSQNNLWMK